MDCSAVRRLHMLQALPFNPSNCTIFNIEKTSDCLDNKSKKQRSDPDSLAELRSEFEKRILKLENQNKTLFSEIKMLRQEIQIQKLTTELEKHKENADAKETVADSQPEKNQTLRKVSTEPESFHGAPLKDEITQQTKELRYFLTKKGVKLIRYDHAGVDQNDWNGTNESGPISGPRGNTTIADFVDTLKRYDDKIKVVDAEAWFKMIATDDLINWEEFKDKSKINRWSDASDVLHGVKKYVKWLKRHRKTGNNDGEIKNKNMRKMKPVGTLRNIDSLINAQHILIILGNSATILPRMDVCRFSNLRQRLDGDFQAASSISDLLVLDLSEDIEIVLANNLFVKLDVQDIRGDSQRKMFKAIDTFDFKFHFDAFVSGDLSQLKKWSEGSPSVMSNHLDMTFEFRPIYEYLCMLPDLDIVD